MSDKECVIMAGLPLYVNLQEVWKVLSYRVTLTYS